jgi:hypothetical protein
MRNNGQTFAQAAAPHAGRLDDDQLAMLLRCSEARDMTEWNAHREANPEEQVYLEGAMLRGAYLRGANFDGAHLAGVILWSADLGEAQFVETDLRGATLWGAHLERAMLRRTNLQGAFMGTVCLNGARVLFAQLQGADCSYAVVDGETLILECDVDRATDFTGVSLETARFSPGLKQTLEYNIRRLWWRDWYGTGAWWKTPLKRAFAQPFWWLSDYGRSTGRILASFFMFSLVFASIYWTYPSMLLVEDTGRLESPMHAFYFSVVTMTTLGFGDVHANPVSEWGQVILMIQVLLGYTLLGALVCRLGVLFVAHGPASGFTRRQKKP